MRCENGKAIYVGEYLQKKLFWNGLVNIVTESYTMLAVSCMINLQHLKFDALNSGLMSTLTIVVTLLLIALPVYYIRFIENNFEVLEDPKFKRKHADLYKELQLRNGTMVLF